MESPPHQPAYVLWWRYSDGSGQGVSRVYFDKQKAEADLIILNEHSYVTYELTVAPVIIR